MSNPPPSTSSQFRTLLLVALVILVGFIALQVYNERQEAQERRDRENSLYCFINDNPIYCP